MSAAARLRLKFFKPDKLFWLTSILVAVASGFSASLYAEGKSESKPTPELQACMLVKFEALIASSWRSAHLNQTRLQIKTPRFNLLALSRNDLEDALLVYQDQQANEMAGKLSGAQIET